MTRKKLVIYLSIVALITVLLVAFVGIPLVKSSVDDTKDVIMQKEIKTDELYMEIRVHSDGKVDKIKVSNNFNTRKNYRFIKSLNEEELNNLNSIITDLKKHKWKKSDEIENNTDVLILDDKLVSFYNYESGYRKALLDFINIYIDSDNAEK